MIGRLKGKVVAIEDDTLVLDVGGVGYEIFCHNRLLASLAPGVSVEIITETNVREDHIHLFGFASVEERAWFRLLATVQRVGNKAALLILGALPPSQLSQAIIAKDTTAFSRLNGIGPKLAERIVAELKDKALKLPVSGTITPTTTAPTLEENPEKSKGKKKSPRTVSAPEAPPVANALEDTISALEHLGYSRSDAYSAALQVANSEGHDLPLNDLIRKSLKELTS